jgi:hypothetical protein
VRTRFISFCNHHQTYVQYLDIPIVLCCVVAQPLLARPFSPAGPASDEKMPHRNSQDPQCSIRMPTRQSRGRLALQKHFLSCGRNGDLSTAAFSTPRWLPWSLASYLSAGLQCIMGCVRVDPRSESSCTKACLQANGVAFVVWNGGVALVRFLARYSSCF